MRLYVHTDLDGIMCAVLISSVEEADEIKFVDPGTVQSGKIPFTENDILADLPYDKRVGIWFDHHESSKPREGNNEGGAARKFEGEWRLAPSAARVVFDYYENPYLEKYRAAVEATDRIDSGQVTRDEVENPQGWFLFSNTLETSAEKKVDDDYRRHTIALIRKNPDIAAVLADPRVAARAANVLAEFAEFRRIILESTVMEGKVAFSDLRKWAGLPKGSNYLVYSLFPDAITSVRIMPEREDGSLVKISAGHNIYREKKSEFDVGAAMKKLGGGGHRPVGGASVKKEEAEAIAKKLISDINAFEAEK